MQKIKSYCILLQFMVNFRDRIELGRRELESSHSIELDEIVSKKIDAMKRITDALGIVVADNLFDTNVEVLVSADDITSGILVALAAKLNPSRNFTMDEYTGRESYNARHGLRQPRYRLHETTKGIVVPSAIGTSITSPKDSPRNDSPHFAPAIVSKDGRIWSGYQEPFGTENTVGVIGSSTHHTLDELAIQPFVKRLEEVVEKKRSR